MCRHETVPTLVRIRSASQSVLPWHAPPASPPASPPARRRLADAAQPSRPPDSLVSPNSVLSCCRQLLSCRLAASFSRVARPSACSHVARPPAFSDSCAASLSYRRQLSRVAASFLSCRQPSLVSQHISPQPFLQLPRRYLLAASLSRSTSRAACASAASLAASSLLAAKPLLRSRTPAFLAAYLRAASLSCRQRRRLATPVGSLLAAIVSFSPASHRRASFWMCVRDQCEMCGASFV